MCFAGLPPRGVEGYIFQVSASQDDQGTEASYMCLFSSWRRRFDIVASCLMRMQAGALDIVGAKTDDANGVL